MKGDFTRMTFDPTKHYSRVLEQQGRVQVDADFNEMTDINLYFLRRLAADLIGPHGGPENDFKISAIKRSGQDVARDFGVASGHYYVDGILCENEGPDVQYTNQPGFPLTSDDGLKDTGTYLAYLDVWERHLTELEDEDENKIGIREVALRGPDTATRTQIVWQVKCKVITERNSSDLTRKEATYEDFRSILGENALVTGLLRARAIKPKADDEPCLISPEARYRGAENQLYRVEIHRSGVAMPSERPDINKVATFKWSRENGSVIFPITELHGDVVTLRHLGRESRFGLRRDDWVEIVDDDYVLGNRAEPLLQVKEIDRDGMQVTLKAAPSSTVGTDPAKHPLLRRWDQQPSAGGPGEIFVVESDSDSDWITLEDGVQIQFPPAEGTATHLYQTGDYWLIPARVATGDVEWPGPPGTPAPRPPHGVEHRYAPLAIFSVASGKITVGQDLRRTIKQLWL